MTRPLSRSCHRLGARKRRLGLAALALTIVLVSGFSRPVAAESAGKTKRKVVVTVAPDYPFVLRNGHFEGQVRLEATVLPTGIVTKVDIKGGNPMLSEYASQAVMRWKYAPGPAQTVEEVIFTFNPNK